MFRTNLKNRVRVKSNRILPLLIIVLSVGGLAVAPRSGHAAGHAQELDKLNRLVQSSSASDAEVKIFREGRDLINDESWERAAAKFREYINKYPKGKDTDAALYWLAFALKKQEKYQEADRTLERLISEYPRSKWKDDASTLRVEISPALPNGQSTTSIDQYPEETKIAALQSLFQGNPERGAAIAADILKRGSTSSKSMKDAAVTLLGQHRSKASVDVLKDVINNETDSQIRKNAIFWLGQTNDEGVLDLLKNLATSSTDNEVNKAAVFAISQHSSPRAAALLSELARSATSRRVREEAIFWLGQRGGAGADDELIRIFD